MDFTNFWFDAKEGPGPADPGDPIAASLRISNREVQTGDGNPHLRRTFSQASSNTCTMSFWYKQNPLLQYQALWQAGLSIYLDNGGASFNNRLYGTYEVDPNQKQRDPASWTHYQYVANGTDDAQLFINGKPQVITNAKTSVPFIQAGLNMLGQYASQQAGSSWEPDGNFAECYFIDGRGLPPTVFGRVNENGNWVPRNPEFAVNAQKYSSFLTTNSEDWESGRPPTAAFDGDTGTYARSKLVGENITFEPAGGITFNNTLRVWGGPSAGQLLQYNDGSNISLNAGAWTDVVTSNGGTLSKLFIDGNTTDAALSAVEIDGEILVDGPNYSNDVDLLGSGSENGFVGAPALMFDGDLTTVCRANNTSQSIRWAPSEPISWNTSIEYYSTANDDGNTAYIYYEGAEVAVVAQKNGWTTIASGPGIGDDFRLYGQSNAARWAAVRIDGKIYVDGAGLDYGPTGFRLNFEDPNNPGKDVSGNGNDFEAVAILGPTEGINSDVMEDSPTNNYAVINSLNSFGNTTYLSNGNNGAGLDFKFTGTAYTTAAATQSLDSLMLQDGENCYWEVEYVSSVGASYWGVGRNDSNVGNVVQGAWGMSGSGSSFNEHSNSVDGGALDISPTVGDIVGFRYGNNGGTFELQTYVNGVANSQISTGITGDTGDTTQEIFPNFRTYGSGRLRFNFGQLPFIYPNQVPGAKRLRTADIPDVEYDPETQFQAFVGPGTSSQTPGTANVTFGSYAKDVTSDTGSWYATTTEPHTMFDGDPDATYCQTSNSGPFSTITFTPSTPIPYNTSVEVRMLSSAGDFTRFNGGPKVDISNSGVWTWHELASGSGTITSIQTGGAYGGTVAAIRVDGNVLVDDGILNVAKAQIPSGMYLLKARSVSEDWQFVDTLRGDQATLCPTQITTTNDPSTSDMFCYAFAADEEFTPQVTGGNSVSNPRGLRNKNGGFSIVTFEGSSGGALLDLTHGLDGEPNFVICKTTSDTNGYYVYHKDTGLDYTYQLEAIAAPTYYAAGYWLSNETNFGITAGGAGPAQNNQVWYMWKDVPGYQKFGSYVGNGNANNVFVYCGFKPKALFFKSEGGSGGWQFYDTERNPHNVATTYTDWNSSAGETTGFDIDIVSNGFKIYSTNGPNSNTKVVFGAWADMPFKMNPSGR